MKSKILVVLLIIIIYIINIVTPSIPSPSQIAFLAGNHCFNDLYLINIDGSGFKQLTDTLKLSCITAPVWSPDGRFIAFRNWGSDLYVIEIDSFKSIHMIDGITDLRYITWSPNGRRIAFIDVYYGNIYALDICRPGEPQMLASVPSSQFLTWSPAGTAIAFASNEGIYVMDIDGSNLTKVASTSLGYGGLSWSPDGQQIAFILDYKGQSFKAQGIYVVDVDGSDLKRLAGGYYEADEFHQYRYPAWSPDGETIVFLSNDNSSISWKIYTIKEDGTEKKLAIPVYVSISPEWSSDGEKFVFSTHDRQNGMEIYVFDISEQHLTQVTQNDDRDSIFPIWRPALLGGSSEFSDCLLNIH